MFNFWQRKRHGTEIDELILYLPKDVCQRMYNIYKEMPIITANDDLAYFAFSELIHNTSYYVLYCRWIMLSVVDRPWFKNKPHTQFEVIQPEYRLFLYMKKLTMFLITMAEALPAYKVWGNQKSVQSLFVHVCIGHFR